MKDHQRKVIFSSMRTAWKTPPEILADLDKEFNFDADGAPSEYEVAPLFNDMLAASWNGRRIFCNHPYGPGIEPFLRKAPEADLAVFLLPARTDTAWFHDLVIPRAREIRFVRGRLKFDGHAQNAPFPSMVVIYGGENG